MKHLLLITFFTSFFVTAQQNRNDSIENIKRELLISIYSNRNKKQIINYDKSFVSEDRLFYESLGGNTTNYLSVNVQSQSEKELVKKTLQNYIDGTSYNNLEQITSAFSENATLYLTIKSEFKPITPKVYAAFFKNRTSGEFNGRVGKILSVDIEKDIATAKVEISIQKRSIKYIDLFLLKKFESNWKIISKTATKL